MPLTITIFLAFVGFTLGLSFYLGRKAKSAGGYFAAHGQVGWFVNGLAFASLSSEINRDRSLSARGASRRSPGCGPSLCRARSPPG